MKINNNNYNTINLINDVDLRLYYKLNEQVYRVLYHQLDYLYIELYVELYVQLYEPQSTQLNLQFKKLD